MISFFRNCKTGESDNVMDIELFAQLGLCDSARLTGVIVALTRFAALSFPVSAVIGEVSATPLSIVFPAIPHVRTLRGAKSEPARALDCRRNGDELPALFAGEFCGFLCRRLGSVANPAFSGDRVAGKGAYDKILGAYLKRLPLKDFPAHLAGMGIVILLLFSPELIGAFAATSGLSAPLEAFRIG